MYKDMLGRGGAIKLSSFLRRSGRLALKGIITRPRWLMT